MEFRAGVKHEETRVMGLSFSEERPHDPGLSRFGTIPDCDDGRSDGRTDGRTDRIRWLIQRSAWQAMPTRCKNLSGERKIQNLLIDD